MQGTSHSPGVRGAQNSVQRGCSRSSEKWCLLCQVAFRRRSGNIPQSAATPKKFGLMFSVRRNPKLGFLLIRYQGEPGTIITVAVLSHLHHTRGHPAGRKSSCHPGLSIPPALEQGWETPNLLPAPQNEYSERLLVQRGSPELFLWTRECLLHPKIKHYQISTVVRNKIQSVGGNHHLTSAFSAF